jgi:tRNA(fMet)-specific endonuclease VapC
MDTNVAIDLIRRRATTEHHFRPEVILFVSATVFGELFHGAFNARDVGHALAEIEDFAAKVKILSCDFGTARWYGQLRQALWRKGKPIPDNDIWIAATAMTHGPPVVTDD